MMKCRKLYLSLSHSRLENALKRFHFEENEDIFYKVYKVLAKKVSPVLYYKYDYFGRNTLIAVITLGEEADKVQESFENNGNLLEAFASDCICMELLSCAYEQLKEFVFRDRKMYLNHMDFLDSLELKDVLLGLKKQWGECPVTLYHSSTLVPQKSVVIRGTIGLDVCRTKHECAACNQRTCIFRKKTGD